jgi:hypothetical protein
MADLLDVEKSKWQDLLPRTGNSLETICFFECIETHWNAEPKWNTTDHGNNQYNELTYILNFQKNDNDQLCRLIYPAFYFDYENLYLAEENSVFSLLDERVKPFTALWWFGHGNWKNYPWQNIELNFENQNTKKEI